MKGLKGKTVVVTGASSGIGEALARECAVQGANVVLGARSLQKLQLIVGDIRSKGGEATYCAVDVTKPEECRNLIDTAVGEYGGLDVLICNAGLSMRALFDDVDLEVLHRLGHECPQLDAQLCHIIASGMFNGIFEIVVHDMPKEQAMRYVDQLRDFYTAGWLKLIGQ